MELFSRRFVDRVRELLFMNALGEASILGTVALKGSGLIDEIKALSRPFPPIQEGSPTAADSEVFDFVWVNDSVQWAQDDQSEEKHSLPPTPTDEGPTAAGNTRAVDIKVLHQQAALGLCENVVSAALEKPATTVLKSEQQESSGVESLSESDVEGVTDVGEEEQDGVGDAGPADRDNAEGEAPEESIPGPVSVPRPPRAVVAPVDKGDFDIVALMKRHFKSVQYTVNKLMQRDVLHALTEREIFQLTVYSSLVLLGLTLLLVPLFVQRAENLPSPQMSDLTPEPTDISRALSTLTPSVSSVPSPLYPPYVEKALRTKPDKTFGAVPKVAYAEPTTEPSKVTSKYEGGGYAEEDENDFFDDTGERCTLSHHIARFPTTREEENPSGSGDAGAPPPLEGDASEQTPPESVIDHHHHPMLAVIEWIMRGLTTSLRLLASLLGRWRFEWRHRVNILRERVSTLRSQLAQTTEELATAAVQMQGSLAQGVLDALEDAADATKSTAENVQAKGSQLAKDAWDVLEDVADATKITAETVQAKGSQLAKDAWDVLEAVADKSKASAQTVHAQGSKLAKGAWGKFEGWIAQTKKVIGVRDEKQPEWVTDAWDYVEDVADATHYVLRQSKRKLQRVFRKWL
ncbi:hypothetical protein HK102_005759 [Quaeritorhiza haematococci]|nr:hypothetical protein HK102_005759 [Quaeritorhiza haematococci]